MSTVSVETVQRATNAKYQDIQKHDAQCDRLQPSDKIDMKEYECFD